MTGDTRPSSVGRPGATSGQDEAAGQDQGTGIRAMLWSLEIRDKLKACGITGAEQDHLYAELARNTEQAHANLCAAVALAQAGMEGQRIAVAVGLCRTVLDREQLAHGFLANREQMVATAEMIAAVDALAGGLGPVTSIVRYVLRWRHDVLATYPNGDTHA